MFLGDYIYEARPRARTRCAATTSRPSTSRPTARSTRSTAATRTCASCTACTRSPHIWDDHEVENNYSDNNPAPALAQRCAGYRAAFEWLPRMSFPSDRHRIYASCPTAALADVFLLDERQYRTGSNDGQARHILGERADAAG